MNYSPTFRSLSLKTDVTVLCCVNNFILAGNGNWISIFDVTTQEVLLREELLRHQNIHGIVCGPDNVVVAFGGRQLCFFFLQADSCVCLSGKMQWNMQDWVLAAHWLESSDHVALLTAHNVVSLWDWRTRERLRMSCCEEKYLLYCASLYGDCWQDLVAIVGTVFQEVVIWSPGTCQDTDGAVLHRLQGHNGAIFSVAYDEPSRRISSTSDDRSVRMWSVEGAGWREANVRLCCTMFAHLARVWRSLFLADGAIASVGEDSLVCVWSREGDLLKRWKVHQGAGVRSVAYSATHQLLVTGGADGGISLWPVAGWLNPQGGCVPLPALPHGEKPRRVGLMAGGRVVAVTSTGRLLLCDPGQLEQASWAEQHRNSNLGSYCVLQVSPCRLHLALASFHGSITLFTDSASEDDCRLVKIFEVAAVAGRIFSLHWLSSESILTCGAHGKLEIWSISYEKLEVVKEQEVELPASKERWTTAAVRSGHTLICGDRLGSIHVYNLHNSLLMKSLRRIHGLLGVCSLSVQGQSVWSTGRDRTLRQFQLQGDTLRYLHADKLPVEWCAGTVLYQHSLLVLGFSERQLVVWSPVEGQAVLEVTCGGGHRSWDCSLEEDQLVLVFVKGSLVHCSTSNLAQLIRPSLQAGLHRKEVNAAVLLPGRGDVLLSAGEDTTLRVTQLRGWCGELTSMAILRRHISSVRALACWRESDHATLVFSAGGRAEMRVWRVSVAATTGSHAEVTCEEVAEHRLRPGIRRPLQELQLDPETRYMDVCCFPAIQAESMLAVFAACSDAFVRLLLFEPSSGQLRQVGSSSFHGRCVLKVAALPVSHSRQLALSLATDGTAAFWDVTLTEDALCDLEPIWSARLHRSGVNACDWAPLGADCYLLVTGGDDNSLVVTWLEVRVGSEPALIVATRQAWQNATAHAAQITGVQFVQNNLLLSAAVDQRVVLWSCDWQCDQLSVHALGAYCSAIADIHGLQVCQHEGCLFACVYGRGVEFLEIKLHSKDRDRNIHLKES